LVVCNEVPDINVDSSIVKFLKVDFPPPDKNIGTNVSFDAVTLDKGTKIASGLLALQQYSPDYVYIMDGDDWFNINIIESIKGKQADLWYADSGYVIDMKNKTYTKKYGICRFCGSTYIFNYKILMKAIDLKTYNLEINQKNIIEHMDDFALRYILGNHRHQLYFYKKRNLVIKKLPLSPVCWILNTGENHSAQPPGKHGLFLTSKFTEKFGISIDLPSNKTSILRFIMTYFDSFKSKLGWILTDKNSKKV
jgi:hypothetical protein